MLICKPRDRRRFQGFVCMTQTQLPVYITAPRVQSVVISKSKTARAPCANLQRLQQDVSFHHRRSICADSLCYLRADFLCVFRHVLPLDACGTKSFHQDRVAYHALLVSDAKTPMRVFAACPNVPRRAEETRVEITSRYRYHPNHQTCDELWEISLFDFRHPLL